VVEGAVRELLGPGRILGNHLVVDLGGGVYAALAHLRRGSLRVRVGDRVAAGLPFRFRHYRAGDAGQAGVPSNLAPFSASAAPSRTGTAGRSPGRRR
jgi:hypothetical protein